MKFTLYNNPVSWILFTFIALILILLGLNFFTKGQPITGFPETIIVNPDPADATTLRNTDSVTVIATDVYGAKGLKRWLHGEGYRKAWHAPIKVEVVFLDTLKGGLRPIEAGGGNQTRSLELVDSVGHEYTLRSINKNPVSLVPSWAYKVGIENIVTEGISAGHPYGALVVPKLADAARVMHTHPRLMFLPVQDALGNFNDDFGNGLYLLEYECKGKNPDWLPLPNARKLIDTDDVIKKMEAHPQHRINKAALVRARLFDIWLGDWDRHGKQWGWAVCDSVGEITYCPIPTDRDNVFYGISGLFPNIINRPFLESRLRPFGPDIDYFPGMLDNSRSFDEYFLKGVDEDIFIKEAESMQAALTDKVIESAIHQWPDTLFALNGEEIIRNLKSRRNKLPSYGKQFYKVLQERLNKSTD